MIERGCFGDRVPGAATFFIAARLYRFDYVGDGLSYFAYFSMAMLTCELLPPTCLASVSSSRLDVYFLLL